MNGRQDFDFLHGQWLVQNRRRLRCLAGSDDWVELDSLHKCWPLLDGFGNVGEYLCDDTPLGALMRLFDSQNRRWRMHWVSSRDGILQPPIEGVFRNGVGKFYGESRLNGRPILVRYVWDKIDIESPRWEQAFSDDDGKNWETDWTMHFRRLDWPVEVDWGVSHGAWQNLTPTKGDYLGKRGVRRNDRRCLSLRRGSMAVRERT